MSTPQPVDLALDYLEFPANNLEQIQAFYGELFGWSFKSYGDEYLAFTAKLKAGMVDGGFYKTNVAASAEKGSVLVVFYAKDLEQLQANIINAGGKISTDTFAFPGGKRFHFTDPCGNELAAWSE